MNNVDVLLVEDTSTQSILMQHMLGGAGFTVIDFVAAEDAIEYLRIARPKLLITDINLPGMDGFQLSKLVKNEPELSSVPVVLLLSFKDREDLSRAIDSQADDLMLKLLKKDYFVPSFSAIWHRLVSSDPSSVAAVDRAVDEQRLAEFQAVRLLNMLSTCFETLVHQQRSQA